MSQQRIHTPVISQIEEHQPNKVTFVIEPLLTGYGLTLGNSLRRVLLSSISGAAVISFRIDGVAHEFTTVAGVKEDVTDITLNIKGLRFKWLEPTANEPLVVTISKQGFGPVTGADIKTGGLVEVVNPEHLIATLDGDNDSLEMELKVAPGRGYLTIEDSVADQTDKAPDFIVVDALFSPVLRVRYKVENTRVGRMTDLDKLILTIETDGAINPKEAFEEAAAILKEHYTSLAGATSVDVNQFRMVSQDEEDKFDPNAVDERLKMEIEELQMSTRTTNALTREGHLTVADVIQLSDDELSQIAGFGAQADKELRQALKKLGF